MPYKVIRAEILKLEVDAALTYYESVSLELGLRFENELQQSFQKLAETPHNYFNLRLGYRRIQFNSFPYMMIYKIDEDMRTVKIFGLFHQHSRPSTMYRKIEHR